MRNYKFRGQRVDTKEWVYGYYVRYAHMGVVKHIIVTDWSQVYTNSYYVLPESVGQYTGLMDDAENISDTEDVEVYEKDIVTFTYSVKKELKVIVAEVKNEAGIYVLVSNRLPYGYIPISEIVDCDGDYFWINGVVIGNLIDNPELLQEAPNE